MATLGVGLTALVAVLVTAVALYHHYVWRIRRARAWLSRGGVLVDVDAMNVFSRDMPLSAMNIPLEELDARADEVGHKGLAVVIFAHRWRRGAIAVHRLRRSGFLNVMNAAGLHTLRKLTQVRHA